MATARIRRLGLVEYQSTYDQMVDYTENRDETSPDELWVLQHPKVFTQGQAGKAEHVLMPGDIPVVQTNRGGQVTYHGPGQLVVYLLLDIKRLGIGPRQLVTVMEESIIEALKHFGIESAAKPDAPGVYVDGRKIASLGLRIRRGASFHGIAVNLEVDLTPFSFINPCGYAGLEMTRLADLVSSRLDMEAEARRLLRTLATRLGQRELIERPGLPGVLDAHNFD